MNNHSEPLETASANVSGRQLAPIDVEAIFLLVKANRRLIAKVASIMTLVVGIYIFSLPRGYDATVVLAPEVSSGTSIAGSLSSMASMVGVDLGKNMAEDAIYPEIYPDIVSSKQFLVELFDVKVFTEQGDYHGPFAEYIIHHSPKPWWHYLLAPLRAWMKKPQSNLHHPLLKDNNGKVNPFWLSYDEDELCKAIDDMMLCTVDKKTSVITLRVRTTDPLVSALFVDSVRCRLQDYITAYRTAKSRNDLAYAEGLLAEASQKFDAAQQEYASYTDSHKNTILQAYITEQERLENELQITMSVYNHLLQQVQMAKAKIQERTPAFTIVQCATVPQKPSYPKRILTILGAIFMSCIGTTAWLYFKHLY